MTKPFQTIDHVANAEPFFLSQYQNSPLFKGFTNAFLKELNDLEVQFNLFLTITSINTAQGVNLTNMGRILAAQSRPVDDELFRVLLYSLAAAYNSEGRPQDIRSTVILAVNASNIFIEDLGGARFSITIFKPDFKFGQALIFDIVNIAKPIGVKFQNLSIADTFSDPTFSFLGDSRPNSEGYAVAVPISVPVAFYSSYVFPPSATISTTQRIYLTSSSANPEQNYDLVVITSDANLDFNQECLASYAIAGGNIGFNNNSVLGQQIRLTVLNTPGCYAMTTAGNYQIHTFTLRRNYETVALIRIDSEAEVPTDLASIFVPYTASDAAAWAAKNPSGFGKTYVQDPTNFPDVYGTSGGGRYSLAISP